MQLHPKKPSPLRDAIAGLLLDDGGELEGPVIAEALTQDIAHPKDVRSKRRTIATMLCIGAKEGWWVKVGRGVYRAMGEGEKVRPSDNPIMGQGEGGLAHE